MGLAPLAPRLRAPGAGAEGEQWVVAGRVPSSCNALTFTEQHTGSWRQLTQSLSWDESWGYQSSLGEASGVGQLVPAQEATGVLGQPCCKQSLHARLNLPANPAYTLVHSRIPFKGPGRP